MVYLIPNDETLEDFNGSRGELNLYERMKDMKGDYYIFHSSEWNEKRRKSEMSKRDYIQWGESDFMVFSPSKGIIFFEVKDGIISYSRERGWIQTNSISGSQKYIDPMHQAKNSMFFFADRFKKEFNAKFGIDCPYFTCCAAWFTSASRSCVNVNLPNNYLEDTTLWSEDAETSVSIEQAINKVFNSHNVRLQEPNDDYVKTVLDVIAPEFGCFPSLRSKAFAAKEIYKRMTREQSTLLEYLEEQEEAAIHGIAGTGKTVLAVKKAETLSAENRVLFLCFNKFLKEHLEENNTNKNIDYYNLDSLYTLRTRHKASSDPDERESDILDFLTSWDDYKMPYKHIIIDEGQDFSDVHLQALHEIARKHKGYFYVFYDRNQFVQGKGFPDWLDEMDCRLVLSRNCRNTREIAVTSTRTINIDKDRIKMRRDSQFAVEPQLPNIYLNNDENTVSEILIQLIKKYTKAGIAKSDIVIVTCKTEGNSVLDRVNPQLTSSYVLTKEKDGKNILFTTARKFKGLEADVVIIVDVDKDVFFDERSKNAFYVGTSRARLFLELIATDSAQSIAKGLTGQDLNGPKAIKAISDSLCVRIGTRKDFE